MASGPSSAVASRPCRSTSASAPERNAAFTTPPRAVAIRSPCGGVVLLIPGIARDATGGMTGNPALIVSYSGVLGGAERILLDCASRLDGPACVACPEGPLAAAVVSAGLVHARLPERSLRLRGGRAAHARALAALARDISSLTQRHGPRAVVAWGGRAVLACALLRRTPVLAV